MLKIGTSKMGSVVDCPRCHKSVVVPPQSIPQAEQLYQILKAKHAQAAVPPKVVPSIAEPNLPESAWDELGDNVDDTELNRWIDELWKTTPDSQSGLFFPPALTEETAAAAANTMALIALQKKHKYTLTLLLVLTPVAFLVGIIFGVVIRGFYVQPTYYTQRVGEGNGANEITGQLYFLDENGIRQPDVDAVIICLPKDRTPSLLVSCQGLRPEDEVNHGTVQLIDEMGGMYTRADVNGSFTLPYQAGRRYLVIKISANKFRAGGEVKPSDFQALRRYFRDPEQLGENYLTIEEFEESGGKHSLRYTFEATN
jgi:hypothetical protein